jgi:hypothetical protein
VVRKSNCCILSREAAVDGNPTALKINFLGTIETVFCTDAANEAEQELNP